MNTAPGYWSVLYVCRKTVHVLVEGPEDSWQQDSYSIEVEENKIYNDILQLEMQGLDPAYTASCRFNILSTDVPFVIDNKGTHTLFYTPLESSKNMRMKY